MTRSSLLPVRAARGASLLSAAALCVAAIAGCGGVGNTDAARLRAVNAATDSGTSNLLVNGSASYGDQTYFNASSYFYISTGDSTFSALVNTQTTAVTARSTRYPLSSGHYYTAFLVGRPTTSTILTTGYSQVVVSDDTKPSLTAGQAAIRVIDAAPDAGPVDVLVNGTTPASAFTGLTFLEAVQYTSSSPSSFEDSFVGTYVPISAGTLSVQVNVTGTSTVLIPATNIPVQAGRGYTLLVAEPTAGTAVTGTTGGTAPTYALQTTAE